MGEDIDKISQDEANFDAKKAERERRQAEAKARRLERDRIRREKAAKVSDKPVDSPVEDNPTPPGEKDSEKPESDESKAEKMAQANAIIEAKINRVLQIDQQIRSQESGSEQDKDSLAQLRADYKDLVGREWSESFQPDQFRQFPQIRATVGRSSGDIEDDWVVFGASVDEFGVRVMKPSQGKEKKQMYKDVTVDDFIKLNSGAKEEADNPAEADTDKVEPTDKIEVTEEPEKTSPEDKVMSILDKDLAELNNPEKRKWSESAFNWLQKNSRLRLCTGIAVSGIAAFTGMNSAIWLARAGLGAAGGAIGWSGIKSGLREGRALQEYNLKMQGCFDEKGKLDEEKVKDKISKGELDRKDVVEMYSKLTEIASAKGKQVMENLEQTEEKTNSKLDKLFPKLQENKYVKWYNSLDWKYKAAIAVGASVGVSLGVGFAGAAVAGSYGAGAVGMNLARVLSSGAMQLGLSMRQKSPEGSLPGYAHSNEIIALQGLIKENFGDLTQEELDGIQKYRVDTKKGRIKDAKIGGAVVATVIGGTYAFFGHHGGEEQSGITNKDSHASVNSGSSPDNTPARAGYYDAASHDKIATGTGDIKDLMNDGSGHNNMIGELDKGLHPAATPDIHQANPFAGASDAPHVPAGPHDADALRKLAEDGSDRNNMVNEVNKGQDTNASSPDAHGLPHVDDRNPFAGASDAPHNPAGPHDADALRRLAEDGSDRNAMINQVNKGLDTNSSSPDAHGLPHADDRDIFAGASDKQPGIATGTGDIKDLMNDGSGHNNMIGELDKGLHPATTPEVHQANPFESSSDVKHVEGHFTPGTQEQTDAAKAALEAKGIHMDNSSHTLADEKALAGGSLKGQDGEGMMKDIYDGLKEKGELPPDAGNSAQVIHDMTDRAKEMGIIDSHGHLTDKIDAGKFDPEKYTKAIVDHDDNYLGSLNHDLSTYESTHAAAEKAVEPAAQAANQGAENAIHTNPNTQPAENAIHNAGPNMNNGEKAVTSIHNEASAREELQKITGREVPPWFHPSNNFDAYNKGTSITDPNIASTLEGKEIGKGAMNYIKELMNTYHTLKPGDIRINGNQLVMNVQNSEGSGIVWTTPLHEHVNFLSRIFGNTEPIKDILPNQVTVDSSVAHATLDRDPVSHTNVAPQDKEGVIHAKADEVNPGANTPPPSPDSHPPIDAAPHPPTAEPHAAEPPHTPEPATDSIPADAPPQVHELIEHGGHIQGFHNGVYQVINSENKLTYVGGVDTESPEYKSLFEKTLTEYKVSHPNMIDLQARDIVEKKTALKILEDKFSSGNN